MSFPAQAEFDADLGGCSPVIAIIRGSSDQVERTLDWLIESRIELVEITTNTPNWPALVAAAKERPFVHVGVGTVLTPKHVQEAADAGADFTVAPGLDVDIVRACEKASLAHLPGVLSPSEIQQALRIGLRTLKLFPAVTLGVTHLRSLLAPFEDVAFVPTGGVSAFSAGEWLDAGAVAVGIGGALTASNPSERAGLKDTLRALAERRGGG